ncbi:hypothetical protein AWC38_SpisGene18364 [Stylophora pistillata]|uniref:Integrase core domain-containing protein n=1 Tax=Stylophora pistillata TaxID=50429 RepID=A0A2B4RKI8_STYPI|nr:hypothetical protein AWC38_SpisGene18364 [Stylophora pistillata]
MEDEASFQGFYLEEGAFSTYLKSLRVLGKIDHKIVSKKIARRVSAVDQMGWDEAKQEKRKKYLTIEYTSSDESELSEDEAGPDVKRFVTKRLAWEGPKLRELKDVLDFAHKRSLKPHVRNFQTERVVGERLSSRSPPPDLNANTDSSIVDSSSEGFCSEVEVDEETIMKHYFQCGFSYEEIILLFTKHHKHEISYITLLRRRKAYGLGRRGFFIKDDSNNTIQIVRQRVLQGMLKELDPEETKLRKAHHLKRRSYHNQGPNDSSHMDEYEKLKPFGFPTHGAIDGFNRKILWLEVSCSNNSPDNVATYLKTVKELEGCPLRLNTDLGTENGLAASM